LTPLFATFNFISEELFNSVQHSRIQTETALEELENLGLIGISGYLPAGTEYYLTNTGKRKALAMVPQ
jgi:hypothetical protein